MAGHGDGSAVGTPEAAMKARGLLALEPGPCHMTPEGTWPPRQAAQHPMDRASRTALSPSAGGAGQSQWVMLTLRLHFFCTHPSSLRRLVCVPRGEACCGHSTGCGDERTCRREGLGVQRLVCLQVGSAWGTKVSVPVGRKDLGYRGWHTWWEGLGVQRLVHLQAGMAWGTEVSTPAGGKDLQCRVGAPASGKGLGYRSEHACGWKGLGVQSGCTCG